MVQLDMACMNPGKERIQSAAECQPTFAFLTSTGNSRGNSSSSPKFPLTKTDVAQGIAPKTPRFPAKMEERPK